MIPAERRLYEALDASAAPVRLWWRDDDAGRDHPKLAALLDLAHRREAPLALAVVPAWLEKACAKQILACPMATVLQHGIAHDDHARPPQRKIELGGKASAAELSHGLARSWQHLAQAFGPRAMPVLVPPWNRIDRSLVPKLPTLGFCGLSTFGSRGSRLGADGLVQINTHLDLVAWRDAARPLGLDEACERLASLLSLADREPIGILSHHLVMDAVAFALLDRLLGLVQDHPKARLGSIETFLMEA